MLNHVTKAIIKLLADGRFHSGQTIANQLQLSRAAVWKHIKWLQDQGLPIVSITNKGYCLKAPFELLDKAAILADLVEPPADFELIVIDEASSTNDYLFSHTERHIMACVAERQTRGKGRRTHNWHTPYTGNVACSIAWYIEQAPAALQGLGLIFALATVHALETIGVPKQALSIKWPNDIWLYGQKLGGILVEVHGEANSQTRIITGIGINGWLPESWKAETNPEITDLQHVLASPYPRNRLIATLISCCHLYLQRYLQCGLEPFQSDWQQYDALVGKQISFQLGHKNIQGAYQGIDQHGHLLLKDNEQVKPFAAGEVSLVRPR